MSQRSRRQTASQRRNVRDYYEEPSSWENVEHRLRKDTMRFRKSQVPRNSQQDLPSTSRMSQSMKTTFDDSTFEPTQGSQSSKVPPLSTEEENALIGRVIKYLFLMDRDKAPIQRTNITKYALPNHNKHFRTIMPKVRTKLKEVFGYNLVYLEGAKYILTNDLENVGDWLEFSAEEQAEMVLLFIILGHIFMSIETGCTEEDLVELLKELEIIEDNKYVHEYFGDVKELLTEKFVKQCYLETVPIPNSDPPILQYKWGARAENELSPRRVLEFMSKIWNGRSLESWPVQYREMEAKEAQE